MADGPMISSWLAAMQVVPITQMQPSGLHKEIGLDFSVIRLIRPRNVRFSTIPPSEFADDFSVIYKLSNEMAIPGAFGSTLVGGLVSAMLYGITTLQTHEYYMHYSEDSSFMKFIVSAIWILDTLHVSLMCHTLYYYLITSYGVPANLEYVVWSFSASALVNSAVVAIVQCFFTHKIYHLCRRQLRWLVTAPNILLGLARIGFGMGIVVVTLVNNKISSASRARFYAATPAVSTLLLAEVLTTVSLCVLLYDSGSRSIVPRTKRLLNTLIIYAVNRCLLTLIVVVAEVITDAEAHIAWTMGLDFVVAKLYANSLLASLNTRQHLRCRTYHPKSDLCMSSVRFAIPPKLSGDMGSSEEFDECKAVVIDITTEPVFDKTTTLGREAGV